MINFFSFFLHFRFRATKLSSKVPSPQSLCFWNVAPIWQIVYIQIFSLASRSQPTASTLAFTAHWVALGAIVALASGFAQFTESTRSTFFVATLIQPQRAVASARNRVAAEVPTVAVLPTVHAPFLRRTALFAFVPDETGGTETSAGHRIASSIILAVARF